MAERATIARPYAKAAFGYAREAGQLDQWSGWLGTASEIVRSEEFQQLERSPGVDSGQLSELIAGICNDGLDEHSRALLTLLTENGRIDYLPEIAERFEELKAEDQNLADVEIVSATELDPGQKERLTGALQKRLGRNVRLQCTVDPALIGGAIVRSGDLAIDGALKSMRERFETEWTG